ncbi:phage tail protein [Oceanimonas doudoroffii]|uniref:Phage tail collar domain-containing protein n=1 Tax=Oceanimonas doudoroffii TaxID=84158 RepID=A0A233RHW0_9GAMM|nr:tail fiber protein [Oceanimonas doudoroffii]OXY82978.1 hypothetical protein B6S08_05610 [Oceanimonas doudoroffii]
MFDSYIGVIQALGFQFAPENWGYCAGGLIPIQQNTALYSLLGTIYGGDARTVFALPDLRGRVPVGQFQGPGLSPWNMGMRPGYEVTSLSVLELPVHSHGHAYGGQNGSIDVQVAGQLGSQDAPSTGDYLAGPSRRGRPAGNLFAPADSQPLVAVHSLVDDPGQGFINAGLTIDVSGDNGDVSLEQPNQVINYCICMDGIYPSRS